MPNMSGNTELPLLTQPLDTATPVRQAQQDQQAAELNHEQVLGQYYKNMDAREKSRLQSTIAGAVQLKPYLDSGDVQGAWQFLANRKQQLLNRIGTGENIDTQETDYALEALKKGPEGIQELKSSVDGLMAAGRVYGILQTTDLPADIQTAEWYRNATADQRKAFDQTKRAPTVVNLGGSQQVLGPNGQPTGPNLTVTPKPEEMPDFQAEQEKAKMAARGEVPETEKLAKGKNMVSTLVGRVIPKIEDLGSSGGAISTDAGALTNMWAATKSSDVGQFAQRITGSAEQSIRNQIKTQKPALINAIRNATGMSAKAMDSNAELQFYMQQIGDEKTDIESQLFAVKMIDEMYGNGNAAAQMTGGTGRVKVRDPKTGRTGTISADQVQAAQPQGLEVVQ